MNFLNFGLFCSFAFFYNLTIKKDSEMSENTTSFEKKKTGHHSYRRGNNKF